MSTWKCKRCGYLLIDGDQLPDCQNSPCPMEEVKQSYFKQVIAIAAMLVMMPFACINYTIGTVCMGLDGKFDKLYNRLYNWSQR